MTKLRYILPDISKNETHVEGRYEDKIISIPASFNDDGTLNTEETLSKIKKFEYTLTIQKIVAENPQLKFNYSTVDRKDVVYVNRQIVRYDYNVEYPEAQPLLEKLKTQFGNHIEEDLKTLDKSCIIGTNVNYRPPYENQIISWYKFTDMTQSIIDQFSVDVENYNHLLPWYGRKFDTVTNTVRLKIVFRENDEKHIPMPKLPVGIKFFSKIYNEDGSTEPFLDCYIWTSATYIREFCTTHNVPFPAPDEVADKISLWGIAYHADTLEILVVKAYEFMP